MVIAGAPLRPPVAPMLARLVRELPIGDYVYEPKWDGFRAIVFADGGSIEIQSRQLRPLTRYFPELVEAFRALNAGSFVLDGEIVVRAGTGFDFPALLLRTHPAVSRVEELSRATPASYVAFDVLAVGDEDLRPVAFGTRRERLARLLADAPPRIALTQATTDPRLAAEWLARRSGEGIDGVVAKDRSMPYEEGKRSMLKVKVERTADCVVGGVRHFPDGAVASLLLGLYDGEGKLRHVGVASAFGEAQRRDLARQLEPYLTTLDRHPWRTGFGLERSPLGRLKGAAGRWDPATMPLDWLPLRPELVCEVAYGMLDGDRFRHPARFRRWRPDRDPASCTLEQFAEDR